MADAGKLLIPESLRKGTEEDLKFYELQLRVPQEGSMVGVDKLTAELEKRIEERRMEVELRMAAESARQEEERYDIF